MRVLRIGQRKWQVLAVLEEVEGGNPICPALETVHSFQPGHQATKMIGIMQDIVPEQGIEVLAGSPRCKHLRGKIWEFRTGPQRGAKLRVLFFRDTHEGRQTVVCTHGFSKDQRKTPEFEIERAESVRAEYLEAKRRSMLVIVNPND